MSDKASDKNFSMTKEELDSFEKALKDEEFRKLLVEYAQEISDPENKKKYEEEIAQMERMRGMDVKFVNPEDGYVVKTTDTTSGIKAFVNICSNEHIGQPSSLYMEKDEGGKKKAGYQWNIPYSLSKPRDDFDRAGVKCVVYDTVFHPDTYKKGQEDKRFKQLMLDTAFDGIQREFKVQLDRNNLKFPKMKFKGNKQPTVIRTKNTEVPDGAEQDTTVGGVKFPYPYSNEPTPQHEEDGIETEFKQKKAKNTAPAPTVPEYRIVHRGFLDLQNFTNARDSNTTTRPKELVIYLDLPRLDSAAPLDLDIFEKQLILDCKQPSYHLDLKLPYPVDEENGTAKFDKSKRQLVVTLPVLPAPPVTTMDTHLVEEVCTEDDAGDDQLQTDTEHGTAELSALQATSTCSAESSSPVNRENGLDDEPCASETVDSGAESAVTCDAVDSGLSVKSDEQRSSVDAVAEVTNTQEMHSKDREAAAQDEVTESVFVAESTDIQFELPSSLSGLSSPSFFHCPVYDYHQDNDTLTFIIHVPNVSLDSVSLGFNDNRAYISFPSESPRPGELPPPDYALYLQFPDGQNLQPDLCNIDVSQDNLVLTLHKDEACKGLWDSFQAGSGEEYLETKYFVTKKTVELMAKEIAEQDPWAASTCEASVKVSSVTDDCLSLEVEANFADRELEGLYWDPAGEAVIEHHMGENESRPLNDIDVDLAENLHRTKLNSEEMKGFNGKLQGFTESLSSDAGTSDSEALSAEKGDNFVPIDLINNAVRTRRSILRRTSSTSTDDSYGDENELSCTPESPGRKNVRFNLTPNVRVFSNKKDKKKRKLEAKIKAESRKYSLDSEGSGSEHSNGTSPVENGADWDGFDWQPSQSDSKDSVADKVDSVGVKVDDNDSVNGINGKSVSEVSNGGGSAFELTNSLIFELDD